MKQKKIFPILLFILLSVFSTTVWGSKIIYPWRSTTAIVLAGEDFEVWFDSDQDQTVNSVQLEGPYNTVNCTKSIVTGNWEYDPLSGNRYNTKITVTVPLEAPADRYNLVLETSSGEVISHGAVKVVRAFKDNYYIMHISDGHIYQGGYDAITLLARKSAMIDIANIMDCQLIIETGDNMYNVRNHPDREENYFLGIENEGIKGMTDATAATFLVPGDHDGHTTNNWTYATVKVNSDFFNDYWGLQNSNFKYGNGRFMLLNNAWAVSTSSGKDHQYQTDDAVSWLNNDGSGGNFFISAGHCYDKMHEFIDDSEPLDLVLAGDKHHVRNDNPFEFDPGSAKVAYIAGSIRDHFEFNLFRINNIEGTYTTVSETSGVVEVLANGDQNLRSSWESNLTLSYSKTNDGSSSENTAIIVNKFNFPIEGARVRFVMSKETYKVSEGNIYQIIENDTLNVIDVRVDVEPNSTILIKIDAADLCPDDPEKTAPGLCGCGVVEGTCPTYSLTVNEGSGNGEYAPFEEVRITANSAPSGKVFDTWVINSGIPSIANILSSSTTLQLGESVASITAIYKDIPLVNGATFQSQVVPELVPGETISVSVIMKNTGTSTWTSEGGYKLGSQNPEDNMAWSLNRVGLNEGDSINPGEEKTFIFDITVPGEDGIYYFQWQMIQENVGWFGSKTDSKLIKLGESGDYLDDCDSKTGWDSSGSLYLNSSDKIQGTNCLEFNSSGTDEFKKFFATPYSLGGSADNAVLQFWYYVSDPSKFESSNQVEIGSSGKPDENEYSWKLSGLSAGWNFIILKISDASKMGNPNLNSINWFRIYHRKSGSITTRVDAIQLIGETNTSIEDVVEEISFKVYPNPLKGNLLSIELNAYGNLNDTEIKIVNILGQTVYSENIHNNKHHTIDVSNLLNSGIYIVRIQSGLSAANTSLIVR
jgi:hypothetical protein